MDGTPCSFFTAVFVAYPEQNAVLTSERSFQSEIGDEFNVVKADENKASKIVRRLYSFDKFCLNEIELILRSGEPNREQIAFEYIKKIAVQQGEVRKMFVVPAVQSAMITCEKVRREIDRIYGFLRFHETVSGAFYSAYSPDNDLTELIMPHFIARFKTASFIIHDVKRHIAGIYNGKESIITEVPNDATVVFSEQENGFLELWKKYYHTVAIPERKNTKQMKQYMPVRYWKFLPEKDGDEI